MKPQRQDTKVIETPFGKARIQVSTDDCCIFYFGNCNEKSMEDYHCNVDSHPFNGFVEIVVGFTDSDGLDGLPKESKEKVIQWCRDNWGRLITPELVKGAKIERLLREIERIKEKINKSLPELLRQREAELVALNKSLDNPGEV